jgi:NADH-quinone oxidoreductase subunit A
MGAAYLANEYAPIFIFILIALAMGILPLVLTVLVATQKPDAEKLSPYECGFEAFEDARMQFDVRFYLLAILFVVFDLETAFLFPWAVVLKDIGIFGFVEMMLFLVVLLVGYIYAWKKGALQWE